MIWVVFAALTLVAVAGVLAPLIRGGGTPRDGSDLDVFRDQLAEVERDLARGVLSAADADSARLEVQRRMLAAGRKAAAPDATDGPAGRAALTAAVAVIVPFLTLGIYMTLGSPGLKNAPAVAEAGGSHGDADFAAMVEQLAARLAATPDDIRGWALLGRSYRQIEKFEQAREAFRRVLALGPEGSDSHSDFGEMATAAAGGEVTAEALEAFLTALSRNRDDSRARFYVGMSYAQRGDARTAIAIWRELTASAPADASWTETVRQQMFQVAQDSQIMPINVEPMHPLDVGGAPAPAVTAAAVSPPSDQVPASDPDDITAPDVSAIKGSFSGENLQVIQAMVGSLAGRLENNPDDYNGWMMLGRSYTVIKDTAGAKRAFGRAMALKPDELAPKQQFIALAWAEADVNGSAPLPEDLMTAARDALRVDPGNAEGLLVEGLAAAKAGDMTGARARWTRAAASASAGGALAAEINRRLGTLP